MIFDGLASNIFLLSSLEWGTKFGNREKLCIFDMKFQFMY